MHSQWPASKTKTCHITRRFQENPPTISRAIGRVGPFFSIHVVQMFCTLSFQKNYICPEIYAVVGSDFPRDTLPCFARVSSTSVTSVRASVVRPVVRSVVVVLRRSVRPVVSVPSCPSRRPLSVRPCSSRRPLTVRSCPSRRRRASSVRPPRRCRRASSVRPSRRRRASSVRRRPSVARK